jgi:hypothetical protein
MATSITDNSAMKQSTVGFLLIFGEIISNEQRNESLVLLNNALKRVDSHRLADVETLFDDLIQDAEFQAGKKQ